MRQWIFAALYAVSLAAVLLGGRRFLQGRYYSLEDWWHYRIFAFLRRLEFENLEKMRLIQNISIEKYQLKRRQGHLTCALVCGGLALFLGALALAAAWLGD